jgi:tight adherence protein C
MNAPFLASLVVAAAGGGLMVSSILRSRRVAPDIGEFLPQPELGDFQRRLGQPFLPRVAGGLIRSLAGRLERLLPGPYLANLDRQLAQAGLVGKRKASEQLAMQLGLAAVGVVALILLLPTGPSPVAALGLLLLPAVGFMLPSARLKREIRTRSDAIFKDLPDIIDMLAIAVEAGSGFEAAISIVCEHFQSPLADELAIALHEMELGMPRRQALQELKTRADLDVVRNFVLAVLQADALGTPIGRVLKAQAVEVRARRRAWAREKAAKLPVKILFPLVLFIFPPILAIVLGPAAGSITQMGG